jgi:uncharacterized protein
MCRSPVVRSTFAAPFPRTGSGAPFQNRPLPIDERSYIGYTLHGVLPEVGTGTEHRQHRSSTQKRWNPGGLPQPGTAPHDDVCAPVDRLRGGAGCRSVCMVPHGRAGLSAMPTVIVARRVRPGAEHEFARWSERVRTAAERFPGHLGSDVQAPSEAHPDEWVIIYRFASTDELEVWLSSPERAELMAEGDRLLDSPAREQRVVEPAGWSEAVTAVMTQRIRPESEAEFRRVHDKFTSAMRRFPGFLRNDLIEPVPGVQDEYAIVFSFASKRELDGWLGSTERSELVRELTTMVEGDRTLNVVGGFGGWFPATGARPPVRWKQAVAVLIALYPTTLTLGSLQRWLVPEAPWALALLVTNVLGVATLTWLLMPWLTRRLGPWLKRA